MMPATIPMIMAPMESTKAQDAVIATRPASIPLTDIEGSGLFDGPNHHMKNMATQPPTAPAMSVLTAAFAASCPA